MESNKKIKPILIAKLSVTNKDSYQNYFKKCYKVTKELEISKPQTSFYFNRRKDPSILMKIFKTLKYTSKLDLTNLKIPEGGVNRPKIICFAKRMCNIPAILLNNSQNTRSLQNNSLAGVFDIWIKYMRKIETCHFQLLNMECSNLFLPNFEWRFPYLLRYQPNLKDLTLSFSDDKTTFHLQNFYFLPKYPASLQRLCLKNLSSGNLLIGCIDHLKNLKDLELDFCAQIDSNVLVSILQLLLKVASSLQGLSLKLPANLTSHLFQISPIFKNLINLTKLKLYSKCFEEDEHPSEMMMKLEQQTRLMQLNNFLRSLDQHEHPMMILGAFENLPIRHLELETLMGSEEELVSLVNFIRKHPDLERIKLRIQCCCYMSTGLHRIREMFQAIDDLALLKQLSISFSSPSKENFCHEISPLFRKIFTKMIPLESFKIKMSFLLTTKDGFLKLLESFKSIAPGLKKLQIDVGKFIPERKSESDAILSFLQSLKSIQSLRLVSLEIPSRQFWRELVKRIYEMKSLRKLVVGELKGMVCEGRLKEMVIEVLQKRGLEIFDCSLDLNLRNDQATYLLKRNLKKDGEIILKRNPSFKHSRCFELEREN